MIAAAPFGDVVQHGADIKRAPRLQMIDQPGGDRRDLGQFAAFERVEHTDRLDGVLVNSEDVVRVELHLADDARPVRHETAKEAGFVHHLHPLRAVRPAAFAAAAEQVEEDDVGFLIAAQRNRPPLVADQGAHGERVQLQATVARHLQHAQHQDRLVFECAAGR